MTLTWKDDIPRLIASALDRGIDREMDDEDRAVIAALMVLAKAVRGEIDLTNFAILCMAFDHNGERADTAGVAR